MKVQFVFTPEWDEVTAVFVETTDGFTATCYAHIGQHGVCTMRWVAEQQLATPEQYAPLLAELQSIGYDVEVVK